MAINLGNLNNDFGGMKLNDKIKKTLPSSSSVILKKKKKEEIVSLPIAIGLQKKSTDLPILPPATVNSVNTVKENKLTSLPTINPTTNAKSIKTNEESINLPPVVDESVKTKQKNGGNLGDLGGTLAKTTLTGVNYLGQGVLKGFEGLMDTGLNLATSKANPYYLLNPDKLKEHQDLSSELIKKDATTELITTLSGDKNFNKNVLDKNSLIKSDNLGGQVTKAIGQMLPAIATGNPTAGTSLIGLSSYGSGVEEAYNEGATHKQAKMYGLGSSITEMATEWITAGIPGLKSVGGLDNFVAKKFGQESLNKVSNSIIKEITKSGYKMIGEGAEEALSEIINPYLKNATYSKDEKIDWNSVFESAVVGGITGGILEAPSNFSNIKTASKNSIDNNNTGNTLNMPQNNVFTGQNATNLGNISSNTFLPNNENSDHLNAKKMNDDFSTQVDAVISGNFPQNSMLNLGNTPKILQDLGLKDLPITLTQKHLKTIMNKSGEYQGANYHNLGVDIVKQLPNALSKPLNVLKSSTKDNSIVVITELADKSENPIIASIKIDGEGIINDITIDTNVLTSAYGKDNYDRFMKKNIEDGNLLYDIDEGIIKMSDGKLQLRPTTQSSNNDTINFPISQAAPRLPTNNNMQNTKINAPIKELNQKKQLNNLNAIGRLRQERDFAIYDLEEKINQKKEEYKTKKNKNTAVANTLNMQISMLNNRKQNITDEYNHRMNKLKDRNEQMQSKEFKTEEQRRTRKQEYDKLAYELTENMVNWKDKKSGLRYKLNTMERNFYDIIPNKHEAKKIIDTYITPISKNNALSEKFINEYNKKIELLNLNEKEAIAVQKLGEQKYIEATNLKETDHIIETADEYIEKNSLDKEKIQDAVHKFRNIYNELRQKINLTLKQQGYKEIDYRKDYFPHYTESHPTSKIGKLAEKLGWKFVDDEIPTTIAGITDMFKPGKVWTSFSQRRYGNVTDYNALKGFDRYIRGAAELIYHTEDIQKLRSLEDTIRYQYSDNSIQEEYNNIMNYDIEKDQKYELIDQLFEKVSNPLGNLVTDMRDYTNNLANKKSGLDRNTEQTFGRKVYNTMSNIQNRLSANMVGLNISSALTNFIPITQAWSQVSTKNLLRAVKQSINVNVETDSLVNDSVFLTNRVNKADRLYKTSVEKLSDKAGFIFEAIDSFTSNTIVRAKYLDNLEKGLSSKEAMNNADTFAKNVIAGRDKGSMPTIFNSKNPFIKLFTSFQLEVNNQFGYMFKDIPRDMGDETKKKLIMAFFKMFFGAWLYNKISESITGRKSAFSPIDILSDTVSTVGNDNIGMFDKISKITEETVQNVPFVGGMLGGGRLPISAALPNIGTTVESSINLFDKDKEKRQTAINNLSKELSKPLFYVVPPFGGGQAKKTIEGLSMYSSDKDIKGSYTASGKLRFPVSEDIGTKVQAAVFGQYASTTATEYFDNSYAPLTSKQQQEYKELNVPIADYWKYRSDFKQINEIKSDKDKDDNAIKGSAGGKKAYEIINNDNYDSKEKQYLLDSISSSEDKTTIKELEKLGNDVETYKYYYSLDKDGRNEILSAIDKYDFTGKQLADFKNKVDTSNKFTKQENIINYLLKSKLSDQQKGYLYSKNYADTEVITNSKISINSYLNLQLRIKDLSADLDKKSISNNSTVSGSKKKKVLKEIANTSGLSIQQKLLLTYLSGYSIDENDYKGWNSNSARTTVFKYIDGLNLSKSEKRKICEKAGFKILKNGKIGW